MDRLTATNRLNDGGRMIVENPQASELYAPLTHSIIPTRSVGSVTYSRATIATVTDHEWVIRNCISGEARFLGARRVQNLHTYSEDITNVVWNATSCTKAKDAWTAPDGTNTAWLVTSAAATALTEFNQNYNIVVGQTYILSVSLKANWGLQYAQLFGNSATFWVWYINIDLSNGTITANVPWAANIQATVTPEANWFYRIQCKATAISTLINNRLSVAMIPASNSARAQSFIWDGIKWFYYWHPQFEDVTGQSIQTAWEYVSTNVLTNAPFHWANVDWVKYFNTTLAWLPISPSILKGFLNEWARTNIFLQSQDFLTTWGLITVGTRTANAEIAPDGTMTADLFTLDASSAAQWLTQSVTTTAAVYAQSVYIKPNGHNYVQMNAASWISLGYVNFDLLNWTVGTQSLWTGTIESLPNGWYRLKVVTNTLSAATSNVSFSAVPSASSLRWPLVAWTGTSWFYIWGAQFELWQNVSSYIPTTTTTVTRNTDSLVYTVANVVSNGWACSAIISLPDTAQFDRRAIGLSLNTNNRIQLQAKRSWLANANIFYGDGAGVPSVTASQEISSNNIVFAWTNGVDVSLYLNNTKYISAGVPNLILTTVDVGSAGWLNVFGSLKNLRLWKTRPTDAELLFLSNQS